MMKKCLKRWAAVGLCIAMVMALLPGGAVFAENSDENSIADMQDINESSEEQGTEGQNETSAASDSVQEEPVSDNDGPIVSLGAYYQAGNAVLEDGQYVLTPERNYAKEKKDAEKRYSVTYGIHFSLSGKDDYAPGTLELRIPAKIFKDRDGSYDANASTIMPIPEEGTASSADYAYRYDAETEEYVITNTHTITSASEATFHVQYKLLQPSIIKNGDYTRDYNVTLTVNRDGSLVDQAEAKAENVRIDTKYDLTKTVKSLYKKYESYPSGWGTPEEIDADKDGDGVSDDYFYVVYKILTLVPDTNTQPAVLKVEDLPVDKGEVIGYRTGERSIAENYIGLNTPGNNFSTQPPEFDLSTPDYDHAYYYSTFALVRYKRSDLDAEDPATYEFKNRALATLTGEDDGLPVTKESEITYKYVPPTPFKVPYTVAQIKKSGSGSTYGGISILESGNDVQLSGTYTNQISVSVYGKTYQEPAGLTTEEEKEQAKLDANNYGKRNVRIELVDDLFYFQDHYDDPLQADDYELTSFQLYINSSYFYFSKYSRNAETGNYESVTLTGKERPDMTLWIKAADGTWSQYGTYHPDTYVNFLFTYMDGTSLSQSNPKLQLPEGTVGVKLVTENTCYWSAMTYEVGIKLKASEHVKALMADTTPSQVSINGNKINSYTIMDVNSLLLYDADDSLFTGSTAGNAKLENAYQRDMELYGQKVAHATAFLYITDLPRSSSMNKTSVSYENDTSEKLVRIHYRLAASEGMTYSKNTYSAEQLGDMGVLKEQYQGTFYDLLPRGCTLDASTLKVTPYIPSNDSKYIAAMDSYQVSYTYELQENWNDTGRTMLIIHMETPEGVRTYPYKNGYNYAPYSSQYNLYSGFTVTFDTLYSWDALADYGTSLLNSAAYRSAEGNLSYGLPDTGGQITEAELFWDLDGDGNPEGTPADYLYAEAVTKLNVVTATELDLSKRVRAENGKWTDGLDGSITLDAEEHYEYRLRIGSAKGTRTKDIILFDALENYHPSDGGPQWRGILMSVDLSQPRMKGIAPVVYYSTSEIFNDPTQLSLDANRDLMNTDLWTTVYPEDPTSITAVAIDLRKDTDGNDYVLPELQTLSVILNMRTPENTLNDAIVGAHAYNNIYLSDTLIDAQNTETPLVIHAGYTQVGLRLTDDLYELPNTGGIGVLPIYIGGVVLLTIAWIGWKKRKSING